MDNIWLDSKKKGFKPFVIGGVEDVFICPAPLGVELPIIKAQKMRIVYAARGQLIAACDIDVKLLGF